MAKLLHLIEQLLPILIFVGIVLFRVWSSIAEARAQRAAELEAEAEARRQQGLPAKESLGRRELSGGQARAREEDAAAAERRRHLQEEIRRRIEESLGVPQPVPETAPPPPPLPPAPRMTEAPRTPPPVPLPVPIPQRQPARQPTPAVSSFPQAFDPSATVERMMREAEEQARLGAETRRMRETARKATDARSPTKATSHQASLLADIKDPASARRAIVAAEVIGPPLANRPDAGPLLPALAGR